MILLGPSSELRKCERRTACHWLVSANHRLWSVLLAIVEKTCAPIDHLKSAWTWAWYEYGHGDVICSLVSWCWGGVASLRTAIFFFMRSSLQITESLRQMPRISPKQYLAPLLSPKAIISTLIYMIVWLQTLADL